MDTVIFKMQTTNLIILNHKSIQIYIYKQLSILKVKWRGGEMNRKPVSSSNIRSIGYDHNSKKLEIEFHSGGIYQYFNVPLEIYEELMSRPSHGKYFHRNIKNKYRWVKIH